MRERRFRYMVEVIPPFTLDIETWHNKFAQSIMEAIKKHGGVVYLAENDNILVKVKEVKEQKEN